MSEVFINKVANSGLITVDLEKYLPTREIVVFDLKEYLFMGLILKEKDFREELKNADWNQYQDKNVAKPGHALWHTSPDHRRYFKFAPASKNGRGRRYFILLIEHALLQSRHPGRRTGAGKHCIG